MSDLEPTRQQAAADETAVMPVTQADNVGGPGGPDDPGGYYIEPGPDRRWWWVAGGVAALLLLLLLILLLTGEDDDDELTATSSTTSSSSTTTSSSTTSTTVRNTTTTAQPTTTTAAPTKTTIAAARCTGRTDPTRPETPVRTLHDAWRVDDRSCAEELATTAVVNELFELEPNGPEWDFQGCEEQAEPDPHEDCAFTYEGGSVHFRVRYGATDGWQVYDMYSVAD